MAYVTTRDAGDYYDYAESDLSNHEIHEEQPFYFKLVGTLIGSGLVLRLTGDMVWTCCTRSGSPRLKYYIKLNISLVFYKYYNNNINIIYKKIEKVENVPRRKAQANGFSPEQ